MSWLESAARAYPDHFAARPGVLMAWGMGKSAGLCVPPSALDSMLDCVYPAVVDLPSGVLCVRACVDMGVFCALDSERRLWMWTLLGGRHSKGQATSAPDVVNRPRRVEEVDGRVIDCAAGGLFAVALTEQRELLVWGELPGVKATTPAPPAAKGKKSPPTPAATKKAPGAPAAKGKQAPPSTGAIQLHFASLPSGGGGGGSPPVPVLIDACHETIAVLCADGSLWTIGDALVSGHGRAVTGTVLERVAGLPPIRTMSVGSRQAAAVGTDGSLWVWGDGLSGNFGCGTRMVSPTPVLVPEPFAAAAHTSTAPSSNTNVPVIASVACCRGQPSSSKRLGDPRPKAGQEGPRMHVVTADGKLWIAGTSHKGLAANHMSKAFMPEEDCLHLSLVGSRAADASNMTKAECKVATGAAEELFEPYSLETTPAQTSWHMGMDVSRFGEGGCTHYLETAEIIASFPIHIHSMALARDGRLFTWGCGSDGRLGLRAYMRGSTGKRTLKCYVSTPSAVEALDGAHVLYASGGRYWTLAVVDSPPRASPYVPAYATSSTTTTATAAAAAAPASPKTSAAKTSAPKASAAKSSTPKSSAPKKTSVPASSAKSSSPRKK